MLKFAIPKVNGKSIEHAHSFAIMTISREPNAPELACLAASNALLKAIQKSATMLAYGWALMLVQTLVSTGPVWAPALLGTLSVQETMSSFAMIQAPGMSLILANSFALELVIALAFANLALWIVWAIRLAPAMLKDNGLKVVSALFSAQLEVARVPVSLEARNAQVLVLRPVTRRVNGKLL